ncbi:hypothetical protein TWF718_009038 [Orbilia javanica]|uniref:Uncharacterized protein n=1 Tax=Orbilia javanica TaxID=47235 RepID=A0AAN8MR64_9PEZI
MAAYSYTPIADLVIDLTDAKQQHHLFLVASTNLRVASPVWRKILDPDPRFAPLETVSVDGTIYKKITIEEVEVESLQIVLGILHYRIDNIPTEWNPKPSDSRLLRLDFSVMQSLALILDEYDCAGIVSLFLDGWMGLVMAVPGPDYVGVGFEDWIFIASVLEKSGSRSRKPNDVIRLVSRELIRDVCMSTWEPKSLPEAKYYRWKKRQQGAEGVTATGDTAQPIETQIKEGEPFDLVEVNLGMVPEKILDHILNSRSLRGYQMFEPLYKLVQDLLNPNPTDSQTRLCKNKECSALALGSLIRSLNEQGFQHLLTKDLSFEQIMPPGLLSLEDLYNKILAIELTTLNLKDIHVELTLDDLDRELKTVFIGSSTRPIFFRTGHMICPDPTTACPVALQLEKIKADSRKTFRFVEGYEL